MVTIKTKLSSICVYVFAFLACYCTCVWVWSWQTNRNRNKTSERERQTFGASAGACAIIPVLQIMQLDLCAKGIWLLKCSLPQHWIITELTKCSALQHSQMSTTSEQTCIKTHASMQSFGGKTGSNGDNDFNSLTLHSYVCRRRC